MKIVGTLINLDFKPIINSLICIQSDNICAATGGTNRYGKKFILFKGEFEIEISTLK